MSNALVADPAAPAVEAADALPVVIENPQPADWTPAPEWRRLLIWLAASALVCPAAAALILALGDDMWRIAFVASGVVTLFLSDTIGGLSRPPGETAEFISILIAAAAAAFGPSFALAASETAWSDGLRRAMALFPAWTAVMLAPAIVVCDQARGLGDGRVRSFVSADFLMFFSAAATALTLAYAIWLQLRPELRAASRSAG